MNKQASEAAQTSISALRGLYAKLKQPQLWIKSTWQFLVEINCELWENDNCEQCIGFTNASDFNWKNKVKQGTS